MAGTNYRLVVRLGELDCRRSEEKDPSACQVNRVSRTFAKPYNNTACDDDNVNMLTCGKKLTDMRPARLLLGMKQK